MPFWLTPQSFAIDMPIGPHKKRRIKGVGEILFIIRELRSPIAEKYFSGSTRTASLRCMHVRIYITVALKINTPSPAPGR